MPEGVGLALGEAAGRMGCDLLHPGLVQPSPATLNSLGPRISDGAGNPFEQGSREVVVSFLAPPEVSPHAAA